VPKRGRSGIRNLYKKHNNDCHNREPLKCDCPWYGKYKRVNVNLARWSGQYVDPRRRQHAVVVLNRLRASIDDHVFRPDGDYEVLGGKQTLRSFIVEWKEHYAKVHDLDFASIDPMLRLIDKEFGTYTLEYLTNASLQIERWLNDTGRKRNWADNTWNRYYQMFNSLFVRAIKWKNGNVVRMQQNPMASIDRRTGSTRKFRVRLEEAVEDRLFAACDRLDDVRFRAGRNAGFEPVQPDRIEPVSPRLDERDPCLGVVAGPGERRPRDPETVESHHPCTLVHRSASPEFNQSIDRRRRGLDHDGGHAACNLRAVPIVDVRLMNRDCRLAIDDAPRPAGVCQCGVPARRWPLRAHGDSPGHDRDRRGARDSAGERRPIDHPVHRGKYGAATC
jgi:hypothetical protein